MKADLLSQQTCAVHRLEIQLRDKNSEIAALQSTADQVNSLRFEVATTLTALQNQKAKLEEEVAQLVKEKRELRNKYDDLKDNNWRLENEVQQLRQDLYQSRNRYSSRQYNNRNYRY